MSSTPRDLLRTVIEPIVTADGLDLEELDVSLVGRWRRVRVVVDADGGVDLDRCADVSRAISAALDRSDVAGDDPYTLEVSSPGVTRPLTLPRHWRRNMGRLVRVVLTDGGSITGRITSVGDAEAKLDVGGDGRTVPYGRVAKAKVQVEFRRTDDGGR
jgi:ribosome maturation factor RimP